MLEDTENQVMMQQGNGGLAKKGSASVASKKNINKPKSITANRKGVARISLSKGNKLANAANKQTAMKKAQAAKATTKKTKAPKAKKQTKAERDAQIRADKAEAMAVRFGAQIASNKAASDAAKARKAAEGSMIMNPKTESFVANQRANARHRKNK